MMLNGLAVTRYRSTSSFVGQQLQPKVRPRCLSRRGTIVCLKEVGEDTFDKEVLKSEVPVLVDFWATWCGPCKLIEPTMTWLEQEYEGALKVVKVETDPNKKIVDTYKIQGLPTILLFRDGKVIEESKKEGAFPRVDVIRHLENFGITSVKTNQ